MTRTILIYGALAGFIVIVPMSLMLALSPHGEVTTSYLAGYTIMIVALSLIFLGVKRYRDRVRGGVINFLPAFLVGLGISVVAGVIYVIGWEITLQLTDTNFIAGYAASMIEAKRAEGVSPAELEAFIAEMRAMEVQYANPLYRLPMTFVEIFPVGLIISLISAALLRNRRFMPARQPIAA